MTDRPWLLMLPGTRWDDVSGTDRQLSVALGALVDVLWVDPPFPAQSAIRRDPPRRTLHEVAPGVHRLQSLTVPASTRPILRDLSSVLVRRRIRRELSARGIQPAATILMSPRGSFAGAVGRRMLFVTDDWVAGAPLMRLDPGWVAAQLTANLASADVVCAVTPTLLESLSSPTRVERIVIPNGVRRLDHVVFAEGPPAAGLVGQLNPRLDLDILEELSRRQVQLLVVGPRADIQDPDYARRLDRVLTSPSTRWIGPVSQEDLVSHLGQMSVGLTPYAVSDFNRASFPLKTLEYLGAGLPVVSADLPAARWLDSVDVEIVSDPRTFADAVERLLTLGRDDAAIERRRRFASGHSWDARARQVLGALQVQASD